MDDLDALAAALLQQSITINPREGKICCGTPEWRGHLCQYHSGFRDGMESLIEKLQADGVG